MRQFTSKLREYDAHLANMNDKDDFKMKDNLPEGQKFPKLKVFAVKELVNYGLGVDSAPSVTQGGGIEHYYTMLHNNNNYYYYYCLTHCSTS